MSTQQSDGDEEIAYNNQRTKDEVDQLGHVVDRAHLLAEQHWKISILSHVDHKKNGT